MFCIDSCKKLEHVFLIFPSHVFYNIPLHYIATGLLQMSLWKMVFFSIYLCSFMTSYPILGGKKPQKNPNYWPKNHKEQKYKKPTQNSIFKKSCLCAKCSAF